MFFLLRCTFWLGLVFLNMDWKIDGPLLPSAEDLARQATAQCLANPQPCAQVAAMAQSAGGTQIATAAQDFFATPEAIPGVEARGHLPAGSKPEHRAESKPVAKAPAGR